MALVNKYLETNKVDEINRKARFFKVISSETEFRVKLTDGAVQILDTVVAAGFDVQTDVSFTKIEIVTEQPQKVQMWVSPHKLNYDALTVGSNVNESALISHYGGSQKVLPFEKNRNAITLFSDNEPFWYGGEGVTVENGIPVAAGVEKIISGSGELHIAINKPPKFGLTGRLQVIESDYGALSADNPQVLDGGFVVNRGYRVNYFVNKSGATTYDYSDKDAKFFTQDDEGNIAGVSLGKFNYKGKVISVLAINADGFGCVKYSGGRLLVGGYADGKAALWEYNHNSESLVLVASTSNVNYKYTYAVHCSDDGDIYCVVGTNGNGNLVKVVEDDFSLVGGVSSTLKGLGAIITEDDGHICICSGEGRALVEKSTGLKVDLLPSFLNDVGIGKSKWVGLNGTEVYESFDSGVSWELAGEFDRNIGSGEGLVGVGDDWYVTINNMPEPAGFALIEQEKLTKIPLAEIRMLKEIV